jgi:hypothetical protein
LLVMRESAVPLAHVKCRSRNSPMRATPMDSRSWEEMGRPSGLRSLIMNHLGSSDASTRSLIESTRSSPSSGSSRSPMLEFHPLRDGPKTRSQGKA